MPAPGRPPPANGSPPAWSKTPLPRWPGGPGIRRGTAARPDPRPSLGRTRGRGEPPTRPDRGRGQGPQGQRIRPHRRDPRARVPVEGRLVLLSRGRPARRDLGTRQSTGGAGRTGVAGAIRRTATNRGLDKAARKGADVCSRYLTNKARYLDYPTALANGWPIATGVIEGACRHLVKDRLDLTGARWGLRGAEAVLKLRAIRCNGDWDTYWTLLDLSPRPGAAPSPRVPLRRQHHPASGMNSLQRSRTQSKTLLAQMLQDAVSQQLRIVADGFFKARTGSGDSSLRGADGRHLRWTCPSIGRVEHRHLRDVLERSIHRRGASPPDAAGGVPAFQSTAPSAVSMSGCAKVKPAASSTAGRTRCPASTPSSARPPSASRRAVAGTGSSAGRWTTRASAAVNSAFVTAPGAVRLTGPLMPSADSRNWMAEQ